MSSTDSPAALSSSAAASSSSPSMSGKKPEQAGTSTAGTPNTHSNITPASVTDASSTPTSPSTSAKGKSAAALARKQEFVAEQMAKKEEAKVIRVKIAETLWPNQSRLREFLTQSGRDTLNVEPHIHVAHLLNMPDWAKAWAEFRSTPGGDPASSTKLRNLRYEAIRMTMTKAIIVVMMISPRPKRKPARRTEPE